MIIERLTPEQRARGFLAESRFFAYVNLIRWPQLRGFVRAEQASALLDARGIDGFIYHYRRGHSTAPRRIPIQLKTGLVYGSGPYHRTANGTRVPIVPIYVEMNPIAMLDRVRCVLDAFDRVPREYETLIRDLEADSPSAFEIELVDIIERSRVEYRAPPMRHSIDPAFSMA